MTPYLTEDEITTYCKSAGLTMQDVKEASATIDSYIGRSFGVVSHTEQVQLRKKSSGGYKMFKGRLRHFPRVNIVAVTAKVPSVFGGFQQVTYDPTNLWFDDEEFEYFTFVPDPGVGNMQYLPQFNPVTPNVITVQYTSGYETIPEEIKIACGQVMDAIKVNGGTTTWKSRTDFDMQIVLSDKEDPIMSNSVIKLITSVRLS